METVVVCMEQLNSVYKIYGAVVKNYQSVEQDNQKK